MNLHHADLLDAIVAASGKAAPDEFLDGYLGNDHPKYPINNPGLHRITKEWWSLNKAISLVAFTKLLTSLIKGKSCTEKMLAGMLLKSPELGEPGRTL